MDKIEMDTPLAPTVLGEVKIFVYSDGNVTVTGPVDNPVLMMSIFGRAMDSVVNHVTAKMGKGPEVIV